MSYFVKTKYPHGLFCWADLYSSDIKASSDFLSKLFGWQVLNVPTDQGSDYTLYQLDGKNVVGGNPLTPDMGEQSFWSNYIAVDNAAKIAQRAEKLGAKIIVPTMDAMDEGTMLGIQDPTGAMIMFWQAKNHIGAEIVNTTGAMCWNELLTHDLATAKTFYSELLGWKLEADETGYVLITQDGRMNGGMMQIDPSWGSNIPDYWNTYFTVQDIDETLEQCKKLGGTVISEVRDVSTGKIATIAEPTGASFNIISMSVEPDHWE